jgi:predicted phage terminase large subunit-like protein
MGADGAVDRGEGVRHLSRSGTRYGNHPWVIQNCPVKGDKVARALSVQPMFSQGMIYAPARDWAELVITEMSMFPAGRFDDLTDSASQGLKHLRDVGMAQADEEVHEAEIGTVMHRPRPRALYPC